MNLRKRTIWRNRFGLLAAMVTITSLGCAQDVKDIDRTQPNKVAKSLFKGVWLHTSTVIDIPQPSAVSFIGEAPFGESQKIIWDIQEKQLVAYPVVETVLGSEKEWHKRKIRDYWTEEGGHLKGGFWEHEIYVGQPAAAFEIESHFDVQRQYNAATGEQLNVLEENTTDRKWYERKYIRVNWAKNLVKDQMFLAAATVTEALDYYQQEWDQTNPDAPTLTDQYIDFVIKMFVEPEQPWSCDIYSVSTADCVGAVVKVRHAFVKADPNNDYQPLWYHNTEQQDRFGFFLTERYARDPLWGYTDWGKRSFINRWNIWSKSQKDNELQDGQGNPLAISCWSHQDCLDQGKGNFCQLPEWFEMGHCVQRDPIPIKERYAAGSFRPVLYHLSAFFPDYLVREAYELGDEWTRPLRDTIAWSTYWDERGMLAPKTCETHEDCNADALIDTNLSMDVPIEIVCQQDSDCAAWNENGICNSGRCALSVACDVDNPCLVGQVCYDKKCYSADGSPVVSNATANKPTTAVLYRDGESIKHLVVRDEQLPTGNIASVRFVNAAPGTGEQGALLVAPNGTPLGPQEPTVFSTSATYEQFYPVATPGSLTIAARQGEKELARRTYVEFAQGSSVLVILVQDKTGKYDLVAVSQKVALVGTTGRVRVVNAVDGGNESFDIGIMGALRTSGLTFRQATPYLECDPGDLRLTVIRTGDNSNMTCHHYEGQGYCVGWKPKLGDSDYDRVAELRAGVPSMFVVCQNQYMGDQCSPEERGNPALHNDCRYWYQRADGVWYNPCGDPQLVAEPYALKKHGDIRYNLINWVPEDQAASPLGYGPSFTDPDTGEIYYGIANIYGADMETYGTYARDLLDLINGKLTKENIMTGDYIREYLDGLPLDPRDTSSVQSALSLDTPMATNATAVSGGLPRNLRLAMETNPFKRATDRKSMTEMLQVEQEVPDLQRFVSQMLYLNGKGSKTGEQRLERIRNTYVEDLMLNNEVKVMLSGGQLRPEDPITPEWRSKLSPATWMSRQSREKESERMLKLGRNNLYMSEFVDDQIVGWARQLGCDRDGEIPITEIPAGGTIEDVIYHPGLSDLQPEAAEGEFDSDEQRQYCLEGEFLRQAVLARMFGGVTEHEVGHTLGLRHNFSGSADVFNFQDQYFSIREKERVLCQEDDGCSFGETCLLDFRCTADVDCGIGTVCDLNLGKCADSSGRIYGVCQAKVNQTRTCLDAEGQPNASLCQNELASCIQGQCYLETSCVGGAPCKEGETCKDFGDKTRCAGTDGELSIQPLTEEVDVPVLKFTPRPWPTAQETAKHRMEYQYSTLMDYGRGINFDVHGIGKYDEAAIRFGYGELLEVYADPSGIDNYIQRGVEQLGLSPLMLAGYKDTYYWREAGVFSHAFRYLDDMIGVEANLRRDVVPYLQSKLEKEMVGRDYLRQGLDISYLDVPYKMCSDEYRGQLSQGGCYYFDLGIDIGEIIYHSIGMLKEYWVFDAFKREMFARNQYGDPSAYYARILDRWLTPLGDAGMYYALYANILRAYGWLDSWSNDEMQGRTLFYGSKTALQALADMVTSPAPGSYWYNDQSGKFENFSYHVNEPGSLMNIRLGDGKFPWTTFWSDDLNFDSGYFTFQHALWIGSFWEKMAALQVMTDSVAQFMSDYVGEQLNVGVGTSVGFNTIYQNLLTNFLGGIVADAPEYTNGFMAEVRMPKHCDADEDCGTDDECGSKDFCLRTGLYPCATDEDCQEIADSCPADDEDCLAQMAYLVCASSSDRYCRQACPGPQECPDGGECWNDGFCHAAAGFLTRPLFRADSSQITLSQVPNSVQNFTMQIFAAVFGLSFLPRAFDPSFIEALDVQIEGHGSQYDLNVDPDSGVQVVRFTDPFGHKTYLAHTTNYEYSSPGTHPQANVEPERLVERMPVAYRIVQDADALRQQWEQAEEGSPEKALLHKAISEKVMVLELLRTLNEMYGNLGY